MKPLFVKSMTVFFMVSLFFSCSLQGAVRGTNPVPETIPEKAEVPATPRYIMGKGLVTYEKMSAFLKEINPGSEESFAGELAQLYIKEAASEGVNHDVAFAQMCLETGFLRYGGLVTADMNNFCGLGSIGPGQPGERFATAQLGVRAHIQHLKAYATEAPLNGELVDPRYRWVKYGSAPAIHDLAGKWAADREYGNKIEALLERLYAFAFTA
ncbi:glucosaminidase domain-containing protein [Treponema sp. OttesenSCG-928-L16]|nr:glucosaminidase domain-containing protein [Treponema sp. OttesenSCG-928-L16]